MSDPTEAERLPARESEILIAGARASAMGVNALWCTNWVTLAFLIWLVPPVVRNEAFALFTLGLAFYGPALGLIAWGGTVLFASFIQKWTSLAVREVITPVIGWSLALAAWWVLMETGTFDGTRFMVAAACAVVGLTGSVVLFRITRRLPRPHP